MVFETLTVRQEEAVLFAEIAAPPMNLQGPELVRDLVSLIQRAESEDAVRVVVFKSADPDYFISHVNVTRIAENRVEAAKLTGEASMALLLRHLSASRLVTIAQIEGRVRGVGSEFALACDMRFAARESAIFGQFEPAFGVIPGAGAVQHLARLMGRGRALEVMLSARTTTRIWRNGTAGSTARCPPTRSAISSGRSPIGSPGSRPAATSWSRTGSMRSRSRRPRTSVATPISSSRGRVIPSSSVGCRPRWGVASRTGTRRWTCLECWASWADP